MRHRRHPATSASIAIGFCVGELGVNGFGSGHRIVSDPKALSRQRRTQRRQAEQHVISLLDRVWRRAESLTRQHVLVVASSARRGLDGVEPWVLRLHDRYMLARARITDREARRISRSVLRRLGPKHRGRWLAIEESSRSTYIGDTSLAGLRRHPRGHFVIEWLGSRVPGMR